MVSQKIIDELKQRARDNRPVRVAVAGTGFIGHGLINQLGLMRGMQVVAVANRSARKAEKVLARLVPPVSYCFCKKRAEMKEAVSKGQIAVVGDLLLLAAADVDIICDCTGNPQAGAELALAAIASGKHYIAGPEMDTVVGPLLNYMARDKGVVYSGAGGDEPGVVMDLYRYVSLLGFEIIAAGKFKGYYDYRSTPRSVKPWADKFGQNPYMIASFADGTKMNIEMAQLANATGLVPAVRGMHCPRATLDGVARVLSLREQGGILDITGVVEVVLGVEPSGGVYVVATTSHPRVAADLKYVKMGDGPNYLFYRPYHLCAVEMGISVARAVVCGEATIKPMGPPVAEVIAVAKRDLKTGELLDNIGGYTFFGVIEKAPVAREQGLLPVALAAGARVVRPVKTGEPLAINDVEFSRESVLWKLRERQEEIFADESPK